LSTSQPPGPPIRRGGPQQRQQGERRQDRDVLKQQDAEGRAAVLRIELAALGQQLQNQRGGGHRQAEADDERGLPGLAEAEIGGRTDGGGGHQHLGQRPAEDGLAHHPQARGLQFQADDEHQEYDAELRDMLGGVDAC
jgi:hypothetical protein